MDPWAVWTLIVTLALLPPFLYAMWLRAREQHDRNPVRAVFGAFFYGATVGVAVAILLHWLLNLGFAQPGLDLGLDAQFLSIVIIAPIVEELSKGLGMGMVRPHIRELEDGLVYGGAIGLGFAATENLLYAVDAMERSGAELAIWTLVLRIFSSMLLHLGATALLGFGYALVVLRGGVSLLVLPYYLVAVLLHALYNFLVTLGSLYALASALVMVVTVVIVLQHRIEVLDSLPHHKK